MGTTTTTHVAYTCDMCRAPTDRPFQPESRLLWSDRDVSAYTRVNATIEIAYCPGAVVLCQPCAARLMRAEADRIDPPTDAQQRQGSAAPQASEAVRDAALKRACSLREVTCKKCGLQVISSCRGDGCPVKDRYADLRALSAQPGAQKTGGGDA